MTQVIVLGKPTIKSTSNPIVFVKSLKSDLTFGVGCVSPTEFKFVELVALNYYSSDFDLMFAYNDERDNGYLYLGHFNDGTV